MSTGVNQGATDPKDIFVIDFDLSFVKGLSLVRQLDLFELELIFCVDNLIHHLFVLDVFLLGLLVTHGLIAFYKRHSWLFEFRRLLFGVLNELFEVFDGALSISMLFEAVAFFERKLVDRVTFVGQPIEAVEAVMRIEECQVAEE